LSHWVLLARLLAAWAWDPWLVFERFTEDARRVVVLAQEEARALGHDYIGTEHILLGLLREEGGLAARVLAGLSVTVDRVRGRVVRTVGSGPEMTAGQIPFRPRAKKVLELALGEALSLGHNYIGTEHVLLGLLREDESMATESEGLAMRILLDLDAGAEKIRSELHRLLSDPSTSPEQSDPAGPMRAHVERGGAGIEFDPTALLAIDLAKREAASLGHEQVGTEHILLGLQLSGQGLAAQTLQHMGVTIERARPLIVAIAGSAVESRSLAEIPLTPAAQHAIDGAKGEALKLGAQSIGTEHILLSLIGHYEGVLGRVLLELDASPQQIRYEVLRMSARSGANRARTVRLPPSGPGLDWGRATLLWRPEGVELRIPLRLPVSATAAFAADEVWSHEPVAGLRREIWTGWLALASPTLLDDVDDPSELRRLLDAAAQRAVKSESSDGARAENFLRQLRNQS
jgi:Clp amino terminal domain, pathogenicity island component